jgi:threonylcarbamoyladenosine tRNA methylthiotransferase MtaB
VADTLPNKLDPQIIKERCERIRQLGHKKRLEFYRRFTGRSLPVLIESKRDGASGLLKGISSNYLPVLIEGDDNLKNSIIEVKIEKLERNQLFGIVAE